MAFGVFILAAVCLLTAFLLFDKILKFQYKNYKDEWEKQGKAIGFVWVPSDSSSLLPGSLARSVRLFSWTFGNEKWMKKEPKVLKTGLFMRLLIFAFHILIVTFFVVVNKK